MHAEHKRKREEAAQKEAEMGDKSTGGNDDMPELEDEDKARKQHEALMAKEAKKAKKASWQQGQEKEAAQGASAPCSILPGWPQTLNLLACPDEEDC